MLKELAHTRRDVGKIFLSLKEKINGFWEKGKAGMR